MSFLYGECDEQTQERMEQYLREHPEEHQRLRDWQQTRRMLAAVGDKEVIAPSILPAQEGSFIRQLWQSSFTRSAIGIAAGLLVVMVSARLTGTMVNYSNGELKISFGGQASQPVQQESLTARQVQDLIDASLSANNKVVNASLANNREELERSIRQNMGNSSAKMNEAIRTIAGASQEQVQTFVSSLREENLKAMQNYMKLTSAEQNKYVEGLLVDFSKYLQEQRQGDLRMFQARINSVEKNTDQIKQETEQILAGMISNTSGRRQTTY